MAEQKNEDFKMWARVAHVFAGKLALQALKVIPVSETAAAFLVGTSGLISSVAETMDTITAVEDEPAQ